MTASPVFIPTRISLVLRAALEESVAVTVNSLLHAGSPSKPSADGPDARWATEEREDAISGVLYVAVVSAASIISFSTGLLLTEG